MHTVAGVAGVERAVGVGQAGVEIDPLATEVTDAPDRIDRLNRMLREYALDNGCEWVDFHPGLADASIASNPSEVGCTPSRV